MIHLSLPALDLGLSLLKVSYAVEADEPGRFVLRDVVPAVFAPVAHLECLPKLVDGGGCSLGEIGASVCVPDVYSSLFSVESFA